MKKVLVISGCNPHSIARQQSANAGTYYIVRGLAEQGYDVTFLLAGYRLVGWPDEAKTQKEELQSAGVTFLPEMELVERQPYPSRFRRTLGMVSGDPKVLCRGAQYADDFVQALGDYRPELIVTVWSEVPTAMVHSLSIPVFPYYGNPDDKSAFARIYSDIALHRKWRNPGNWLGLAKAIVGWACFRRAHRKVVRRLAGMANVAKNDSEYYRDIGVPNTSYVRNMFEIDSSILWQQRRDETEQETPLKIIANAGQLSATGNTIGLAVIASKVLPELKKGLGEGNFEIHLFGRGQMLPFLRPLLDDPHIKLRGFVEDLDTELLSAPIFLIANGYHPLFRVGNSRILHGWALGACMVIFEGTREAMPEIADGQNALTGRTPEEIAQQIIRAGKDRALRRQIGQNGYETVTALYDPRLVVADLIEKMENSVRQRAG